jgi:hypothetical protein
MHLPTLPLGSRTDTVHAACSSQPYKQCSFSITQVPSVLHSENCAVGVQNHNQDIISISSGKNEALTPFYIFSHCSVIPKYMEVVEFYVFIHD